MLRLVFLTLIAVAFVACDRDAPTKSIASAPAGKASDFESLLDLFGQSQSESSSDVVEDSTQTDSTQTDSTQAEPEEIRPATLELGGSVEGDREALEALDRSANWRDERPHGGCRNDGCKGGALRNWLSRASLKKWDCVEVNSEGRVVALELPCKSGYGAWFGTIPPEIGQLTHLEVLRISVGSRIHGPLPPEIGQLRNLRVLDLSHHRLGYDRDRLITYRKASEGWRENNPHYGGHPIYSLPAELGNLTNLEVLNLDSGDFAGEIPPDLGNLTNLKVLNLGWGFSQIPPELGDLTNLEVLILSSSGSIPPEFGNLRSLKMLRATGVEGPLPPELGRLTQLDTLWLHAVRSGSIPPEWGGMINLRVLYLSGIHEGHLEEGQERFGGRIPTSLGNLTKLEHLTLANADWEGPLPASLGQLEELKGLWIYTEGSGSYLSGRLPPEWSGMRSLERLAIRWQELEGPLPEGWAFMQKLEYLDLRENFIEGPLPDIWGQMENLKELDLSLNFIDEQLPSAWGQMQELRVLNLEENDLTGPLPEEWQSLRNLEELNLNLNQLTGPIPQSWNQMESLRRLRLENNQLSGKLPNLRGLSSLGAVWLGGNNFEPDVPSKDCFSHSWYPSQLKVRTGTYRGQPTYRIHVHGIYLCPGDPPPESGSDYLLGG